MTIVKASSSPAQLARCFAFLAVSSIVAFRPLIKRIVLNALFFYLNHVIGKSTEPTHQRRIEFGENFVNSRN